MNKIECINMGDPFNFGATLWAITNNGHTMFQISSQGYPKEIVKHYKNLYEL